MRLATVALIATLCSTIASAAKFEARSEHYSLTVNAGDTAANVVVTDLATNKAILAEDVPWTVGHPSDIFRDVGDLHLTLRLSRMESVTAYLAIDRREMEIERISGEWLLAPRRSVRTNVPVRVGGDVRAPKLVHRVEPLYPEEARKNRIMGIVIIETIVDEKGHVTSTTALKPLPGGLTEAAIAAVKQWVFEPGTLNGLPVPVIFNVTVSFLLPPPEPPR
jgi:protein TonB